jgi:hypothetical protein
MGTRLFRLALLMAALLLPSVGWAADETFLTLDDFENYTDDEPNRIFDAWADGWNDPAANGAVVGNPEAPFAEQIIVHGGAQAMIFKYDNTTAKISEALRTLDSPLDITVGGTMKGLMLWYQGQAAAVGAFTYDAAAGTYTVVGAGAGITGKEDQFHFVYKRLSGDGVITAKIESIEGSSNTALAGVMIRGTLDANSPHGMVAVTPSNRAQFIFRTAAEMNAGVTSTTSDSFTLPHWIRLTRAGSLLKAEHSANGTTWTPIQGANAQDPSMFDIWMDNSVYVGLAVSGASSEGATCQARFAGITVSGSVPAGPFAQSADVGIASNDPEPLYVALGDAAGNVGVAYHPAGDNAVLAEQYTQWAIALDEFSKAGVDLTAVNKIFIGVGNRDNPQNGGAGTLYFDDIHAVRRMPLANTILLLAEGFEGLPLGPNKDETVAGDAVWTKTPPTGWTLDDSGVPARGDPANGVDEWEGWSFADSDWWPKVDDQRRSEFTLAIGAAAIADSDEYDDKGDPVGTFNTFMSTPEIDVRAIESGANTIILRFDSSWRPEDSQTATVTAKFDDREPVEVMRWESNSSSPLYHDHNTNEMVTVSFARPAGAKKMVLTFGYFDAANNWWWAIDNVEVLGVLRSRTVVMTENFDELKLGPNVEEGGAGTVPEAFTHTPPVGWSVDRSKVAGYGNPAVDGITEWGGWSFAEKEFWASTDAQRRDEFTLAKGNIAVADSDEWDDSDHPADWDGATDPYATFMTTSPIDISALDAGTLQLKFDSSWRPEIVQTANVTASYDGATPIEIMRWESESSSPKFKNDSSTNQTITIQMDNPAGARSVVFTFGYFNADNNWWWAVDNIEVSGLLREKIPLFAEDFEGLPLGPNKDESTPGAAVWTKTAPEGWTHDDSGVPNLGDPANGVDEWEGWTFADKDWWALAAENQRRAEFALAVGTVAVADSDEYDDKGDPVGTYNTYMSTPAINVAGMEAGTLELVFDSSWRPEDSQTATITASYDGAAAIEVMRWESASGSAVYHDHRTNETVMVPLRNPAGAKSMVLTFGYFNAQNNWWWAIDNVLVRGLPEQRIRRVFFANFEGLPLQPALDEAPPGGAAVWTKTAPEGWIIDDSKVPGAGDPNNDGVTEWAGWSFADKSWWSFVAADQGRSGFSNAKGAILVADCDEWDDLDHAAGEYNAFISTPAINVAGVDAGSLKLAFDSAWQQEALQTATITVKYDSAAPIEVLKWESDGANPNAFKADAVGEHVIVDLKKPAGAKTAVITFGLGRAGNNWFWALDNLEVTGISGGNTVSLLTEDFEDVPLGPPVDEVPPPPGQDWTHTGPEGWLNDASQVPGAGDPNNDGVTEWAGWSFANKDWWVKVAEDQKRSEFVSGQGTVAVADPDEWDDKDHPDGLFNAYLSTPPINIDGADAGSLQLIFDSSWRQEAQQTASVTVQYDGGQPVVVLLWPSEGVNPAAFKADATNEEVIVGLNNPAGAKSMVITFGLTDAGNNWWWAIDNIEVIGAFGK